MRELTFQQAFPNILRAAGVRAAQMRLRPEDREDLLQQVALKVWLALARFDPARSSLKTYVERVTRNELVSFLRRTRQGYPVFEPLDKFEQLQVPDPSIDLCVAIRQLLADGPLFDQAVARSLAEYSVIDTSRLLGVSRACVYRSIGRLRTAFRIAGIVTHRKRGGAQ